MTLESFLFESGTDTSHSDRIAIAHAIEREMPKLKARWMKELMIDAPDELLGSAYPSKLERVTEAGAASAIKTMLFKKEFADSFFSRDRQKIKNKMTIWRFNTGPNKDSLAIVLAYGVSGLHVGVLPIVLESGVIANSPPHSSFNNEIEVSVNGGQTRLKKLPIATNKRNAGLSGFLSWSSNLEDALVDMAKTVDRSEVNRSLNFRDSPHGELLLALAERFLHTHVETTLS